MSQDLQVSVVICAYTEARWVQLLNAVESVKFQTAPPHEIIVVIDHNPALFDCAREQITGIKLVENRESPGLSGARNSGIAVAQGQIVAFMDEDALAAPDWLEQLTAHYRNPQVLGVGGVVKPFWMSGRPGWFPPEFDWVVGCAHSGMPLTLEPVRNPVGCNMSFRRGVLESVGGFRHGIGRVGTRPVGCEETELCIRMHQRWPDGVILYEPKARVDHAVPGTRASWGYFGSRCYSEGLSKALVATFVGAQDGLAEERNYALRTLPLGVVRGLRDALRLDLSGIGRAGAIVLGLAITTVGYLSGRVSLLQAAGALTSDPIGEAQ